MTTPLNLAVIGYFGLGRMELLLLIIPLCILPVIFYMITLQNTFKIISPENRKMEPGKVWLSLIPIFGTVWQFMIINRLADSLKAEYAKRNLPVNEDRPGVSIGVTYCILNCCTIIPFLGYLAGLGGLVCWIIYWVKINNYKQQLMYSQSGNSI